jgi:Undecaprenyl-phosphate glucose phosphotransferase
VFCVADFCRALYESSRLKFILAWVTFGGLFLPTAFLMSVGFPEKYALPLMLLGIPPFQYAVFCLLKGLNRNDEPVVAKTDTRSISVLKIVGADSYHRAPENEEEQLLRFARRRGHNLRRVLIVGMPAQAQALFNRIKSYRHLGLHVAGLYLVEQGDSADFASGIDLIRSPDELSELVRSGAVDQIFVALPLAQASRLKDIQACLGDERVALYFVPDLGDLATLRALRGSVEEFNDLQIIRLQSSPHNGWNVLSKRLVDITVGGFALLIFAPLMAVIASAVKLSSRGPVFYRQERMGLDGKRFQMLKFRTTLGDDEKLTGLVWAMNDDSRVTSIGRWLRQTSLDELPQLINVMRGEMSLVGPRPERPPLIDEFRKTIPKYMLRHKVKAGMTGWAQIHGWRGNTSLATRIEYDLDYIENWSLKRDIKILFLTLLSGFRKDRTIHS